MRSIARYESLVLRLGVALMRRMRSSVSAVVNVPVVVRVGATEGSLDFAAKLSQRFMADIAFGESITYWISCQIVSVGANWAFSLSINAYV